MYVKLVTEEGKRETCFECTDYEVVGYGDEKFLLINRYAGNTINFELDWKNGTEVYITNNQGRTIESYRWQTENQPK